MELTIESQGKFVPVVAKSHTSPYKIHRYFARRPWNLFEELIKYHSKPGDIILDPFCGGGVTVYESLKLSRKIVASDINPLSTFIVRNMFHKSLPQSFELIFKEICDYAQKICRETFSIKCPSCKKEDVDVQWFNLSHVVKCTKCENDVVLSNKNKIKNGKYRCPNTDCSNNNLGLIVARIKRSEPRYENLNAKCTNCKKQIFIEFDKKMKKKTQKHILELLKLLKNYDLTKFELEIPRDWDRQEEDLLYEKGIVYFKNLFTKKNFYLNILLLNKIKEYHASKYYQILRFIFSDSLRDTNIMTFVSSKWQNGVPNSWAKHAYWLPPEFCELNPYLALINSYKTLMQSVEFNQKNNFDYLPAKKFSDIIKNNKNSLIRTGTLSDLNLPKNSIDVIITDPPYGSNVQYLELSAFWFMWNADLYDNPPQDHSKEAIVNRKKRSQNFKTYTDYENNLLSVFLQCKKVLKNNGKLIMTFNNKDINSWLSLLLSVFKAGFHFEKDSIIFQDGVSNYRQTAHTRAKGSAYGDFVYEFSSVTSKSSTSNISETDLVDFIRSKLHDAMKPQNNLTDRNYLILQFFNAIMPKIEQFVRSNKMIQTHNLYQVFTRKDLEMLICEKT